MARQEPIPNSDLMLRQAGGFKLGSLLVYPPRGLFAVLAIRPLKVDGGTVLSLILSGDDGRSSLAVPVAKAEAGAVRPLASRAIFEQALGVLGDRRRLRRGVWARRAQGYEAAIKTGDPLFLAGVLRDLHRAGEQSFSERQIFERALERLASEYAAVMLIERDAARAQIRKKLEGRGVASSECRVPN